MGSGRGKVDRIGQEAGQVSETSAVQTALGLLHARPAARAGVLAGARLPGAVGAADRGIALIVERVVGNVVLADVIPDLLLRPVRERIELPEPEALVPGEFGGLGAGLRVRAADSGDPEVDGGERRAHRLDLADPAAGVRVTAPELVAVEPLLLLEGDRAVAVEIDAVALLEAALGLVGLREEDVGVEVEEA